MSKFIYIHLYTGYQWTEEQQILHYYISGAADKMVRI